MILHLVTIHPVAVNHVISVNWWPNENSVENIVAHDNGVRIHWNLGVVFVPWSNVRYAVER